MILFNPLLRQDFKTQSNKVKQVIVGVGKELGARLEVMEKIAPDILFNGGYQSTYMGLGVAEGAEIPNQVWSIIRNHIIIKDVLKADLRFVCGFLEKCYDIDTKTAHLILDEILINDKLNSRFLIFQNSIPIDKESFKRISSYLKNNTPAPKSFLSLIHNLSTNTIDPNYCADILHLMSKSEDGLFAAIRILQFKYQHKQQRYVEPDLAIKKIGKHLLEHFPYDKPNKFINQQGLDFIYTLCFERTTDYEITYKIITKIFESVKTKYFTIRRFKELLDACSAKDPRAVLDCFWAYRVSFLENNELYVRFGSDEPWTLFAKISDQSMIKWCQEDEVSRTIALAQVIIPYARSNDGEILQWTRLSKTLLNFSDTPLDILEYYYQNFKFTSWSGNLSDLLIERIPLIDELIENENKEISDWALTKRVEFSIRIEQQKEFEKEINPPIEMETQFE